MVAAADAQNYAQKLGITPEMVVQELGWDEDTDDDLRVAIEDAIDADLVDGDYGNVVDAVVLWWRDDDGDLVDALVDALTDLVVRDGKGAVSTIDTTQHHPFWSVTRKQWVGAGELKAKFIDRKSVV